MRAIVYARVAMHSCAPALSSDVQFGGADLVGCLHRVLFVTPWGQCQLQALVNDILPGGRKVPESRCWECAASVVSMLPCVKGMTADPYVGVRTTDPYVGVRTTDPCVGVRTTDPYVGVRTTDPCVGVRTADPYVGVRTADPYVGISTTDPCVGGRITDPCVGAGPQILM